tara:strand:- start:1427 stop:2653 length:1227 start_codon:yes stop_codon:yes gene_type:complete
LNNLNNLIEENGSPDALIDHWDYDSKRYAIWGFEESFVIENDGKCKLNDNIIKGDPFDIWQNIISKWKTYNGELSAIGYISYDLKNLLYPHIPFKNPYKTHPLVWFGKPKYYQPYNITNTKQYPSDMLQLKKDLITINKYMSSINKIKTHLSNGDVYQINYTQPKKYQALDNPISIYLHMRNFITPPYGTYINSKDIQILSFSPERLFKTSGRTINAFPMKGTRPRSLNRARDKFLYKELINSIKDRAEHLMIVDLLRNDIGKICNFGSVQVKNLYNVNSYKSVHQMVSEVYGKLHKSLNEIAIIKALFPGGSVTGAPKEEAMKIIDSLENYQRSIYTGSLGYILNNGNMDFSVAIRTITMENNKCIYPIGGGIVWDSNYIDEWNEAQQKSEILTPFIQKYEPEVKLY